MNDYDFSALNDKEFEVLSTDILSQVEGTQIDRFKQGRDQGVDGKFFSATNKPVIIQVKHWINSGIKQLLNHCEREEKYKVQKLNPSRYIFVCSLPLSNNDKIKLSEIFSPYLHQNDIYGKEKLNDYLRKPEFSSIEKNHYKLWMSSTNVLSLILNSGLYSQSEYSLDEIRDKSKYYVKTENHDKAHALIEDTNCLIVTGEPGAGKTTLAESLCFQYFQQGYEFIEIEKDVSEAWDVFQKDKKQLFYFDDFLGRNYLDSLQNKEDSKIIKFIRAINSSDNKKFILTSRSSILNQGKQISELFKTPNVYKHEYELNITTLKDLDKAHILYNHLYFSSLPTDFIEQFYINKRYRKVINHKNFNPRLISFITDFQRFDDLDSDQYWKKINEQLDRPKDIWEFVFNQQVNDLQRLIIWIVTLKNGRISADSLLSTLRLYNEKLGDKYKFSKQQFDNDIEILTGSLLNRFINEEGEVYFDLFNPSIADYVIPKICTDIETLSFIIFSLNNLYSFNNVHEYYKNNFLNKFTYEKFVNIVLGLIETSKSRSDYFEIFLQSLHQIKLLDHSKQLKSEHLQTYISDLNNNGFDISNLYEGILLLAEIATESEELSKLVNWNMLIPSCLRQRPDHYDLTEISGLILHATEYTDEDFTEAFEGAVRDYWEEQAQSDVDDAITSGISVDELEDIPYKAEEHLESVFQDYQIDVYDIIGEIMDYVDFDSIEESVKAAYEDDGTYYRDKYDRENSSVEIFKDDIDLLFER
ncbi:ATP-binding protein [Endozoicomonas sp. G2_1]|uniref:nSTAND3 domain-containing NTPase n=1 Tax=Endozoicomonas sp. G2_1 TaxID=2821091 RepID=UPI001ADB242D|nr:ATP-binding protein [Endozoicomonas sp. G2_1]MBO9490607.1 ATP-binding protein [Endozoicomonas sp. G2_1]